MVSRLLTSKDLLAELEQIAQADRQIQPARAWQTLSLAATGEDFDVSLDFALEHETTRSPYGCEDLIGNISEWCLTIEGNWYDCDNLGEFPVS